MRLSSLLLLSALILTGCADWKTPTRAPTGITAQGGGATEYLARTPGGPNPQPSGALNTTTVR